MLRIQKVSGREVRQTITAVAMKAVERLRDADVELEDGIDEVIADRFIDGGRTIVVPQATRVSLSAARDLILRHNGDTAKIGDEIFQESERERLVKLQQALEENERKKRANDPTADPVVPRNGVDRGVRSVFRAIFGTAYFARNRAIEEWNDEDYGLSRFRDTITGDLPSLKVDQPQQTPRYIKALEDMFGKVEYVDA